MPKKSSKKKTKKEEVKLSIENRYFCHLIECTCVLPTLRQDNLEDVIYHKFPVFSSVDENNNFNCSYEACNNCGVIHKVTSMGMSEISLGEDEAKNILTIEDMKFMIPTRLGDLLEKYNCEKWKWQEVLFMFQNNIWGKPTVIDSEYKQEYEKRTGKLLIMNSKTEFLIKPFESDEVFFI